MKSFIIILLSSIAGLLSVSQSAKGSSVDKGLDDAKIIIIKFLREVYNTQDDALKIAHQYIEFEDSPDSPSEFSSSKRYEVAAAHITLLREGEAVGFASPPLSKEEIAALQVVPYTSLISTAGNTLLKFRLADNQSQYLYVVLKNNVAWKYFYVKENRIYSFDYLLKGESGPAYLFSY